MKPRRGHLRLVNANGQPEALSANDAMRAVKEIAQDTAHIAVIGHARKRRRERDVSHEDISRVLTRGMITEGPYISTKTGWWRMNVTGRSAGEEITCVIEIDWPSRIVIVTVY